MSSSTLQAKPSKKDVVAAAAARREGTPVVAVDSLGHEVYNTQGIDRACAVAHDYHFI
jgi:hypothetical protein